MWSCPWPCTQACPTDLAGATWSTGTVSFPAQCAQSESRPSAQGGHEHALWPSGARQRVHASPAHGAFCASVRRRRCSHCDGGGGRGCDVLCTVPYGSRDDGLGWCCRSKGGPPWKDWKKRSCSLPRTVWKRQNASRVLDCAVVVIVVLLPDSVFCRCVWYCLCAFQIPGRLRDYSPRYRVRSGHLSRRPEAVWFPIKTRSARTRERICRASNSLEVGRLVEPACPSRRSTRHSSRDSLCMVAWLRGRLCAACAAVLSANEKIQPAKR